MGKQARRVNREGQQQRQEKRSIRKTRAEAYSSKNNRVSWCFKPSQTQRITSGLKKTFITRYVVERTNKAEIRPEEQSGKT